MKHITFLFIMLFSFSQGINAQLPAGYEDGEIPQLKRPNDKKSELIYDFMTTMIKKSGDPAQDLKKYIHPKYYKKTNYFSNKYMVKHYKLESYKIISMDKKQVVVDLIGSDLEWVERLTINLAKDGGLWYILPQNSRPDDSNYIIPWAKVESFTK